MAAGRYRLMHLATGSIPEEDGPACAAVPDTAPELVFTADDFGIDRGANDAIVAAHRDGVVTSASLMVGEPAAGDAAERARDLPALSTGLHVVLCNGAPVSPPASIPDLVGSDGRFPASPARAGLRIWLRRRRAREQVEREIRAQLERFLGTGLSLDHVDGHHHLHAHPVIFDVLVSLAAEYGAGRVRLMREDGIARVPGDGPVAELSPAVHRLLARAGRRRLAAFGASVGASDRVYGLRATGRVDARYLAQLVPRLVAPRVEIYAHPSRSRSAGRREEAALRSRDVCDAIRASGYQLVNSRGEPRATPPGLA